MTSVAVMQPYFVPYAGYFRLFAAADIFVVFDCVQFPRRGWVHRNRFPGADGNPRWLTLPLVKAKREALIRDLRFPPDSSNELLRRLRRFPVLAEHESHPFVEALAVSDETVADYIIRLMGLTCSVLGLPFETVRSSTLGVPPELRGQDRIIDIVKQLKGNSYINASGGRDIYDGGAFRRHGINLRFLDAYRGPNWSILHRLLTEDVESLGRDIRAARHGD